MNKEILSIPEAPNSAYKQIASNRPLPWTNKHVELWKNYFPISLNYQLYYAPSIYYLSKSFCIGDSYIFWNNVRIRQLVQLISPVIPRLLLKSVNHFSIWGSVTITLVNPLLCLNYFFQYTKFIFIVWKIWKVSKLKYTISHEQDVAFWWNFDGYHWNLGTP